jgi:hypothetical protein
VDSVWALTSDTKHIDRRTIAEDKEEEKKNTHRNDHKSKRPLIEEKEYLGCPQAVLR